MKDVEVSRVEMRSSIAGFGDLDISFTSAVAPPGAKMRDTNRGLTHLVSPGTANAALQGCADISALRAYLAQLLSSPALLLVCTRTPAWEYDVRRPSSAYTPYLSSSRNFHSKQELSANAPFSPLLLQLVSSRC